jgi:hypothetical protein
VSFLLCGIWGVCCGLGSAHKCGTLWKCSTLAGLLWFDLVSGVLLCGIWDFVVCLVCAQVWHICAVGPEEMQTVLQLNYSGSP